MAEPAVALVFSPEPWVERLHRHCADHGGARIRQVVVEPRAALEEPYDTLVVSHRWPALTPGLAAALHARGRRILGVFDLGEPAGHEHLVRLGADAIVAADAPMDAFVEAIVDLGVTAAADRGEESPRAADPRSPRYVVAVGGTSGSGATEIAIELARGLAGSGSSTVLVDADESAPAIMPRLGLPGEPNLRSAIDGAVYDGRPVSVTRIDAGRRSFDVLGGLPSPGAWAHVHPEEVLLVLEQLAASYDVLVANVGSHLELVGESGRDRFGTSRSVVGIADAFVSVANPTPVGLVRTLVSLAEVRRVGQCPLHVIVNRAPRDAFRRAELHDELVQSIDVASFGFVPEDRRVADAAWTGVLVANGPFTRSVNDFARRAGFQGRRDVEVALR